MLEETCKDVVTCHRTPLFPLTGEKPPLGSNWTTTIKRMYVSHEAEKNTEYMPRLIQVEKGSLTAAVFSISGGMGRECDKLVRQIAMKLSQKRGERYCDVVGFVRRRIRYAMSMT